MNLPSAPIRGGPGPQLPPREDSEPLESQPSPPDTTKGSVVRGRGAGRAAMGSDEWARQRKDNHVRALLPLISTFSDSSWPFHSTERSRAPPSWKYQRRHQRARPYRPQRLGREIQGRHPLSRCPIHSPPERERSAQYREMDARETAHGPGHGRPTVPARGSP